MSSSLSIFRNRSAQVPVYLEIATCLPLMNMSRIVILQLACTFISFPFTKNSYEESNPGNKNQKARYSWRKANPGRMSTSGLRQARGQGLHLTNLFRDRPEIPQNLRQNQALWLIFLIYQREMFVLLTKMHNGTIVLHINCYFNWN